jgi:hypothetical protein
MTRTEGADVEQAMHLERSVSAGPHRGVEQVCTEIATFVADLLDERAYPDTASVYTGLKSIISTLRYLGTIRRFAEPAISVRMPELIVLISVNYDPDTDNLDVPSLALLDKLTGPATIEIVLHATEPLPDSLRLSLRKASTERVTFKVAVGTAAAEWAASRDDADDSQTTGPVAGQPVGEAGAALPAIVDAKIVPAESTS